jgi:hypothetical protein
MSFCKNAARIVRELLHEHPYQIQVHCAIGVTFKGRIQRLPCYSSSLSKILWLPIVPVKVSQAGTDIIVSDAPSWVITRNESESFALYFYCCFKVFLQPC